MFYTLLHIRNENIILSHNDQSGLDGYIGCINTLAKSLALRELSLTLLTNQRRMIEDRLDKCIEIIELDFTLDVPKDIKFYSAHFKIDVLNYLGEFGDDYSIFIDSDVVCNASIPPTLTMAVKNHIAVYYDITEQVYPSVGMERIIADKERIMKTESLGLWAGGEYISGPRSFFKILYEKSMSFWKAYLSIYESCYHQGDEMVVSCAIESLLRNGYFVADGGASGIIGRFWDVQTLHVERKVESLYDHFLIHLPARKIFLSELQIQAGFNLFSSLNCYNALGSRLTRKIKKLIRT